MEEITKGLAKNIIKDEYDDPYKGLLDAENEFYFAHRTEFIEKYLGKEVLIYKGKLQGVFDKVYDAMKYARKNNFKPNYYMIKTVREKEPIYAILPSLTQVGEF